MRFLNCGSTQPLFARRLKSFHPNWLLSTPYQVFTQKQNLLLNSHLISNRYHHTVKSKHYVNLKLPFNMNSRLKVGLIFQQIDSYLKRSLSTL